MLYFVLRPLTRIALKAYFRRITINGLANLPKDKPVLLCCNHPTGFIEPCLLACFLPRVLHFLVRGDLFEKPLLRRILLSTNQIPIYRFRDGYQKLRDNHKVMNISYEKLSEGKAILIFPEASTKEVKHLRPIAKGAARMALETKRLYPDLDLAVVPVGVNYSNPNSWRSYVTINIGAPFFPEHKKDEKEFRQETLAFTRRLSERMSEQLLVLNEGVDHEDLDKVLVLGQWRTPVKSSLLLKHDEREKFDQERALSENLRSKVALEVPGNGDNPRLKTSRLEVVLVYLLLPYVVNALLLNAIPVLFGMYMRNKYVREKEFYASVAIAASLGLYMILFPIVFVILAIYYGWWALLLFLIPAAGLVGLLGYDFIRGVFARKKLRSKLGKGKSEELYLEGMRLLKSIRDKNVRTY